MAKITFLDANVLIVAHGGLVQSSKEAALDMTKDPARAFVVSPFLYLETVPMAIYRKSATEIQFLNDYFDRATFWINDYDEMVRIAQDEAARCGMNALDALHVAAAHIAGAEVLITLEKKPAMYRTSLVRVAHLSSVA